MKSTIRRSVLAVLVLCLGSCQDSLSLDSSAEDPQHRFDHIRRRLAITIVPTDEWDGASSTPPCSPDDCEPEHFVDAVRQGCQSTVDPGRTISGEYQCASLATSLDVASCTASQMLSIIDAPMTVSVALEPGGGLPLIEAQLPPQDQETNHELARLSVLEASNALAFLRQSMQDGTCSSSGVTFAAGPTTGEHPLKGLTHGEEIAQFYREALELLHDAVERSAAAGAAISDAAYSRRTDTADAALDALAPFASRTATAHMILGGDGAAGQDGALGLPALSGVADHGFFTRPRLSGEAQRAVELIRAAALDPDRLLDTALSVDEIVADSADTEEALGFRLGHLRNIDSLKDANTADEVYARFGVSRAGFSEAREHLREELRAFDRSRDILMPAEDLQDGGTTGNVGIALYAAVGGHANPEKSDAISQPA